MPKKLYPKQDIFFCSGCRHFYGSYRDTKCCNYIFDTGTPRPCPFGRGCTVRTPGPPKSRGQRRN